MKKITLNKVVLENFMCYAHAEFDLYAITKIMAKNARVNQLLRQLISGAYLTLIMS